jgi:transposase-like protein
VIAQIALMRSTLDQPDERRYVKVSPEIKRAVVEAIETRASGVSKADVFRRYGVPTGTGYSWIKQTPASFDDNEVREPGAITTTPLVRSPASH